MARKSGPGKPESSGIERKTSIRTINSKPETRISKQTQNSRSEYSKRMLPRSAVLGFEFGTLPFVSDFDTRISSFPSRSTHPGNFRQTQHPLQNLLRRRVFDLVDTDRISDVEAA